MKIADVGTTFARPQDLGFVFPYLHKTFISAVESAITTDTDITFLMKRDVFNLSPTSKTGSEFYIENAYELLDEAGEFYYNAGEGMIYYKPYPGEDLSSAETYVGAVEGLVNVGGSSSANKACNITFENLTFRYGAYDFISKYGLTGHQADGISSNMFTADDGKTAYFAQFAVNNADNIKIEACEFSCLGSAAISMIDSVSNSSINGNIIRDIAGTGIRIGAPSHQRVNDGVEVCRDIDITNNVLRRTSSESFNNTAISIYYEKYINVSNNDIGSLPYTGISAGWGWTESVPHDCSNITISNNKITDVMQTLDDGGGIYTLGTLKDSEICGNYLKGHASISGGMIYNDEGSAYIDVHDNVILDATNSLQAHLRPGRTRHLNYYDNYANNLTQNKPENDDDYEEYYTSIVMEDLKDVDSCASEVAQIESNAGLTEEYRYLLMFNRKS